MKKIVLALSFSLVLVMGLAFAYREIRGETEKSDKPRPRSIAERNEIRKNWEASAEGQFFKKWESSPEGQKVLSSAAKISRSVRDSLVMEAVVTSLSLPPGSRLGFGIMVKIKGEDYILSFGPEKANGNEFASLHNIHVNDKILVRSHFVSYAPKYAYPIVAGDYVERDGKILFKRVRQKGGC